MEQKKIRTYILYAIGEILLVVIGILIALQINNWNEDRKEAIVSDNLKSAFLSDLNADLVLIDSTLSNVNERITIFENLKARYTASDVTESEIVSMIKNEYDPFIIRFIGFNDNTFRSSSASGTIALIEESEREQVFSYYVKQNDVTSLLQLYEEQYAEAISYLNENFPSNLPFIAFSEGPVYEQKWSNPDFDELTSRFNNVGTAQRNLFRLQQTYLTNIRSEAELLIDRLE
jgi:hypothetical protein